MIYNIDYTATNPVTIISVKGYPTDEAATNAKQNDNAARCIARTANDLASLNNDVLVALADYKAKKGQTIEPTADAIWAILNPSKPEKNSGKKDLLNDTKDGISSDSGAGAATEGKKMATKKKAAKKKVAKKAAKKTGVKKSTGPRGEKTLKVKSMLERKSGCTRAEILDATGWPSVSVQAMAKAGGLKLRQEKEKGKPTRYFGS